VWGPFNLIPHKFVLINSPVECIINIWRVIIDRVGSSLHRYFSGTFSFYKKFNPQLLRYLSDAMIKDTYACNRPVMGMQKIMDCILSSYTLHSLARTCHIAMIHVLLPRKRERPSYEFGCYFSILQFKQALSGRKSGWKLSKVEVMRWEDTWMIRPRSSLFIN